MTDTISKQNKRRRRPKVNSVDYQSPELGLMWVKDTLSKAVWFPTTKTKFNKIVLRLEKEKRTFTTAKNIL